MKILRSSLSSILVLFCLSGVPLPGAAPAPEPVTPGASPEARALLATLQSLTGHSTLTGQHNYPNTKNTNSVFAAEYTGKTPAIFSSDWGHAKAGNSDSYLARPDIVQEAIRQHKLGALITLCWHAVPPTTDEPGTFQQLPGGDPKRLTSVQGKLLDEQFKDVLTPGTALHTKWCEQVDAIAVFLKQLEAAHVPVLWRPYHEMNGDWFWWGGRTGEYGTASLYRQLFDRLVNHHQLKNLIWVWSVDRPSKPAMQYAGYFPGLEFIDILALDVYHNDFLQSYYDGLVALAGDKPVTLAEVGNPPSREILRQQPKWIYYVTWAGMVRNATRRQYSELMQDPRILGLDDAAYAAAMAGYREACGLPPLKASAPDFSGIWVLDEEQSKFDRMGAAVAPARLEVTRHENELSIRSTRILEYAKDETTEEKFNLDGIEVKSEFMNAPRVTTARLDPATDTLVIESVTPFLRGPAGAKFTRQDTWAIRGRTLTIQRQTSSPSGVQNTTLVYQK